MLLSFYGLFFNVINLRIHIFLSLQVPGTLWSLRLQGSKREAIANECPDALLSTLLHWVRTEHRDCFTSFAVTTSTNNDE